MSIGIYKIENPNGKVYIGQSVDIEKRLHTYKSCNCKGQSLIYNSIIKYGFINHKTEIIIECSISELNDLERFYIEKFKSNNRNFGLNL